MLSSKVYWHLISRAIRIRRLATSAAVSASASHYDVLGLTPNATQAEVKAAYYKLSKQHHPDTSGADDEDAEQFRKVTEAYEVLGNHRTRQLYDKGLYGHFRPAQRKRDVTPDHPQIKFYQSRMKEGIPGTSNLSHNIYNFDEWARKHYSEAFSKTPAKDAKPIRGHNPKEVHLDEGYLTLSLLGAITCVIAFISFGASGSDIDVPKARSKTSDKPA